MNSSNYENAQSEIDSFRSQHNLIPTRQIQEKTAELNEYLRKTELTDQNIDEYTGKIALFLKEGATISDIFYKNTFSTIVKHYQGVVQKISKFSPPSENLENFLLLLEEITLLSDQECQSILEINQIPQILESILKYEDDKTLNLTISVIFDFTYERHLSSNFFNIKSLIKNLYTIYNNFYFMNRGSSISPYSVTRLMELIFYLFSICPDKEIDLAKKISISITNILGKKRSSGKEDISLFQLKITTYQLYYLIKNSKFEEIEIFFNSDLIQLLIKVLQEGGIITKNALKCFTQITNIKAISFIVVNDPIFINLKPDVNDLETVKLYCIVWLNIIKVFSDESNITMGRLLYIKKKLNENIISLLQYFHHDDQNIQDLDCKKIINETLVALASFNDENVTKSVVNEITNIFERIEKVGDDKKPSNSLFVARAFLNVANLYLSGKNKDVIQDLGNAKNHILNVLKPLVEKLDEKEAILLNEAIQKIDKIK